jgi:hypothetical protein
MWEKEYDSPQMIIDRTILVVVPRAWYSYCTVNIVFALFVASNLSRFANQVKSYLTLYDVWKQCLLTIDQQKIWDMVEGTLSLFKKGGGFAWWHDELVSVCYTSLIEGRDRRLSEAPPQPPSTQSTFIRKLYTSTYTPRPRDFLLHHRFTADHGGTLIHLFFIIHM